MNFKWFPFDSQVCPIYVEAYGNRDHQMELNWREENAFEFAKIKLQEFDFKSTIISDDCKKNYTTGNYSCIEGKYITIPQWFCKYSNLYLKKAFFVLERTMGYYVIHAFLPSALCVLAGIGGCWIKLQS